MDARLLILPLAFGDCGGCDDTDTSSNDLPPVVSDPAMIDAMLDSHNAARAIEGVDPLTWSETAAAAATEWATHLAGDGCVLEHNGTYGLGENLYWASIPQPPEAAVTAWVDEKADYDYDTNTCADGKMCGHYTQVVWHNTEQVGCASALCPDNSQIWMCTYDPPGNWVGEKPF